MKYAHVLTVELIKQKKGYQRSKTQLNEMKREDKIREERVKRNELSLKEIWDYVK